MSSATVVVIYSGRRAAVKAPPTRFLSEIHTEACTKLGVDPQNFALKKGNAILDLSLQIRLTNLSPGAKLDLVPAKNRDAPITIVLRTQEAGGEPVQESTGTFTASSTIWEIMRKLEAESSPTNNAAINITERAAPSGTSGSGRLHYVMPVARVMNREVSGFSELQQTLSDFGIRSGRQLVTLRYKETDIPFEVALEEIAGFSPPKKKAAETGIQGAGESSKGVEEEKREADEELMIDAPGGSAKQEDTGGNKAVEVDKPMEGSVDALETEGGPSESSDSNKPVVSVFRPSQSDTLAATQINVPDKAYEVGITEAKLIQANIKKETIGKRLPSDREIEEKKAAVLAEAEKVERVVIKVRLPDGYTSEQNFLKIHTSQDLYDAVRATLRYPNEPFLLRIPPRETLPQAPKRLTTDLKLRTGATVHLVWGPDVSAKAKKGPALRDEFIKNSKALPMPKEPEGPEGQSDSDDNSGEGEKKGKRKSSRGGDRASKENKLMGILSRGFGKK
ncbi:GLUT4 regulating protein TUG-domain-containing protein [Tuber borchii]|uniref:GLUT4 regulating protein TUG-domain-containing protein n=1 Tax=Tuber borchii TaxID=42251 RepID=A0A2T6ZIK8_TUBBO|nr:GLUT4 regulating protein TUG-domain-containing protein [Tuber borchii]